MDTALYPELSPDAGDPGAGLQRFAAGAGITLAPLRVDDWQRGDTLTVIAGRRAWLTASPRAVAHEEGRAAEYAWDVAREQTAGRWNGLVEEAYNTQELRRLVPFLTHGRLTFHRAPAPPFSHDLPEIGPADNDGFRVGGQGAPLSTHTVVTTVAEAIALVVEALPPD